MKKNIVTIIFLFFVIFVTLMFGQDVEQFDVIDQTDPNGPSGKNNGTYFTKETSVNNVNVSVFSALKDFSNEIRNNVNNYETTGIKTNLENCLKDNNNDKLMCYNTHYTTQMQSIGQRSFDINGSGAGKKLVDAVNRNTKPPTATKDPTDIRVTNDEYETTKSYVKTTYRSNRQIQLDLDRKMNEMLSEKSGIKLDSATKQNSTMYVGILWTVSAATALYYIFNKI